MPSNILILENDTDVINTYATILNGNLKIEHQIVSSFNSLEEQLANNNYTHVIINNSIHDFFNYLNENHIKSPVLIITERESQEPSLNCTCLPITYEKIFSFISETSGFSCNTLQEYALDDEDILKELKKQLLEEFEENFIELPLLIQNKNLVAIKSKVHQISSKFSLLEMDEPYRISKEIDMTIIEDAENQLKNCQNLLVDIAVVIDQLKANV